GPAGRGSAVQRVVYSLYRRSAFAKCVGAGGRVRGPTAGKAGPDDTAAAAADRGGERRVGDLVGAGRTQGGVAAPAADVRRRTLSREQTERHGRRPTTVSGDTES